MRLVRKNALQDALRPVAELGGNVTIRYSPLVKDALDHGFPVVALETGIITHALPHPMNLETALAVEEQLKAAKVVPATIGVIDGDAVIGLTPEELTRLAKDPDAERVSIRELPIIETRGSTGGVTLAAAVHLAHRADIKVCATTGLGGVHRAHTVGTALQESSDLTALAIHPLVLITAGVRPMLDVPATLERLETLSVPVLGYRSDEFAGFYIASSGFAVDHRVDNAAEIAAIARARDELGLTQTLLISNPIRRDREVPDYDERLAQAVEIASRYIEDGEDDTQILLASLEEATGGIAWQVNREIYRQNVALAAEVAKELASTPRYTD